MKMYYNGVPIKSMNVNHYELSTQDSTVQPEDVQSGLVYYAKGARHIGTGKSFEFASYGGMQTNQHTPIPTDINVIKVGSLTNPVQLNIAMSDIKNNDFTTSQTVGNITVDGVSYPINVIASNNMLKIECPVNTTLQVFYGKDNYKNMSEHLQYNYAGLELPSCRCHSCLTMSYVIDNEAWIEVPYATDDYIDKYYNLYGDKCWYHDQDFSLLWDECPSHQ